MRTIDKIITKVNTRRGAPMGRPNVIPPHLKTKFQFIPNNSGFGRLGDVTGKQQRIYDCKVPMSSCGAYDSGGAYWGIDKELRVSYTKDLTLIYFYRV